jgi:peptidoglycan-associated lipoprotein
MKRFLLLLLVLTIPVMFAMNCGKTPPPAEETQPVIEELTPPEPEPEPKPEPELEPEPEPIKNTDFMLIYFDFDKYNLVDSAKEALEHNAALLKEYPDAIIKIEGHCDKRGTDKYNLSLGDNRAKAAKDYLRELGINENRLQTISYGKRQLAFEGDTEPIHAKNRRCEFVVESQ